MPHAATAQAEAVQPDPDRAVSARLDPAGTGKILRLLRTLIAYGRNLVEKLREEDDPDDLPWYAFLTSIFGTTNPALITVTIIRGLLRAAALQARLSRGFASLPALPLPAWAAKQTKPRGSGPCPRKPHPAGWTIPPGWPACDPSLDRLPTPEEEMFAEIVEEDRNRSIDAILLDICLDLGIVPQQMDPATWDELRLALTRYGGDPAPLVARGMDTTDPAADAPTADHRPRTTGTVYPPWPAPFPPYPVPAGTGPP